MPPKKKKGDQGGDDDLGMMRAARFGRVKNTLSMGFGTFVRCRKRALVGSASVARVRMALLLLFHWMEDEDDGMISRCFFYRLSIVRCLLPAAVSPQPVGLPNVGKSSLTNLLAGAAHAEAANYPFCTIDPNVVQCIVPDQKFKYLVDTWKPPSVVPAVLKVTDIAGLIRGASEGAGLGNAFLSHIAAVDGIYHLIRAFDSDEVIHVDDSVDPIRDLETIQSELCAKDKEVLVKVVEREKDRVRKEKMMSRSAEVELSDVFQEAFDKCKKLIDNNTPVQTCEDFTAGEVDVIRDWGLSTL